MIAEFYIRIAEKVDAQQAPDQYRILPQAGDVIVIKPKGWCWGSDEISSPDHIIIAVEVESIAKAEADFLAGETFDAVKNPFPLRKKSKIDLSNLLMEFKTAKDPEAIKAEYQAIKEAGRVPIFGSDKGTTFKIPEKPGFDVYDVRAVKPDPEKNPFVVGDDPFEVG